MLDQLFRASLMEYIVIIIIITTPTITIFEFGVETYNKQLFRLTGRKQSKSYTVLLKCSIIIGKITV